MSIYNQYEGLVMARTQPVPIIIHGLGIIFYNNIEYFNIYNHF